MIAARNESDDVVERGKEIYDRLVKPHVTHEQSGQFVVIDTVSEDFEIDVSDINAVIRLRQRRQPGRFHIGRVGRETGYEFGSHRATRETS